MGSISFADTATILVISDVAHPVQAVLDRPMPPRQFENASRISLLLVERCEPVDDFTANFSGGYFLGVTFYAKDLSDIGEFKVIIEGGATPNLPGLQAPMRLFSGAVLRGEKSLNAGRQCPDGGWADCLWR